jgi:hypothetical protein
VFSIIALHLGISVTLYVGLFFTIGITSSIGLLPSGVMNWIDKKIIKTKNTFSTAFYKTRSATVLKKIQTGFLVLITFFCLAYNVGYIPSFRYALDDRSVYVTNLLKLEQYWGMFSPSVYKIDGWYVYRGIKPNDSIWDIYNNKPGLDYTKPKDIDKMYPSDRWRKFAENYEKNGYNFMRPYYCKYLIKEWNKKHPENKIAGLYIFFLMEESLPDYKTAPIKKQNACLCYDDEFTK